MACTPRPGPTIAVERTSRAGEDHRLVSGRRRHICPISMTYSVVPALRHAPELAREWEPRLTAREYDQSNRPAGAQGGRDLRHGDDREAGRLRRARRTPPSRSRSQTASRSTGHKWFCSAPMSDAFLMLAQAPKGLSCFLVPRWLPDGTRNPIRIQRLKDKLGIVRTPRARSNWSTRGARSSARRGEESGPSSRWSTTPASIACSVQLRSCAKASRRRRGTRTIAPHSGRHSISSR